MFRTICHWQNNCLRFLPIRAEGIVGQVHLLRYENESPHQGCAGLLGVCEGSQSRKEATVSRSEAAWVEQGILTSTRKLSEALMLPC